MDEKILIYLVLGIIYFLFNALKKKKPEEGQGSGKPANPSSESDGSRPMSFEELLREITEGKKPQQTSPKVNREPAYSRPLPQTEYVDYDDDIEDEEKSFERVKAIDDERANQVYEDAKKLAFNRPSLEETLKVQNVNTTYGKFEEFEKRDERNLLLEYTQDLRDPKGFKKALILSEVLNRKHF